jgi:hypothetical protein
MFNVIFFLILQVSDVLSSEHDDSEGIYECKEDSLTDNLLKLLVSEFILRYSYYIYWNVYLKLKSCFKKNFDWRTDFELSDEFVWVLAIYQIHWLCLFSYPVVSFFCVISMLLHTRFLIYRVQN